MPLGFEAQFVAFKKKVAAQLKRLRDKRFLSVPKMAKEIRERFRGAAKGMSEKNLYNAESESAAQDISLRTLYWLLLYHDMSPAEFFEFTLHLDMPPAGTQDSIAFQRLRRILDGEDRATFLEILRRFDK